MSADLKTICKERGFCQEENDATKRLLKSLADIKNTLRVGKATAFFACGLYQALLRDRLR